MKLLPLLLLVTALSTSFTVSAETDGVAKLRQALANSMPNIVPTKISETPVDGLYEVIVGSQVVYMSADARYMIEGDLIDWKTKRNVSEEAKSGIRLAALDKLGADNMLIYKPEKVDNTITVISDINCGYCRKLHSEMPEYMKNNIEVRYIFMSERGGSAGMKKTISVWCADDPQQALNIAKAGGEVEEKTCDNPIKKHAQLAHDLGVRGTPAIILESGRLLAGYVPVGELAAALQN